MADIPHFTLSTGQKIPSVAMGCWMGEPGRGEEVTRGLTEAFKVGYRHLDTAAAYMNEKEVGQAVRESGLPRDHVFITTKVWNTRHHEPEKALDDSLAQLGMDYVDLYLMHWPQANVPGLMEAGHVAVQEDESIDYVTTWQKMEQLLETGKTKAIGVSNFSLKNLKPLLEKAKVVPTVNQIEAHPYLPDHEVVAFCAKHNIHVTAYSPLGQYDSPILRDPDLKKIADETGSTIGQVALSWAVQRGTSVAPKSSNPTRMKQNITLVKLTPEQMNVIDHISDDPKRHKRLASGPYKEGKVFGWTLEQLGWEVGF